MSIQKKLLSDEEMLADAHRRAAEIRKTPDDRFRKVESTVPSQLLPCRLCGSPAELWQRWERDDVWRSFGACTNVEDIDGQECHFHLPDADNFYCERKVEAVQYWNTVMGRRAHETSPQLSEAETLLQAWADLLPPNGKLYWEHVGKARDYFKRRAVKLGDQS